MPPVSPPYRTMWAVDYWAPGFWLGFFNELNAAAAATGPVTVSSWWRSPSRNLEVGGNRDSQHLIGTAVDFVTEEPPPPETDHVNDTFHIRLQKTQHF